MSKDSDISEKIINLAETSTTDTDGTLYIQCLQKHRSIVTEWTVSFLATYTTVYPNDEQPLLIRHTSPTANSNGSTAHSSHWSKHQSFLEDDGQTLSFPDTYTQQSVPGSIIIGQNMSYIAAASRSSRVPSTHSNVSSPTNSKATHKTNRELLLETEVTNPRKEFADFKATQENMTVLSKSSGKSLKEVELEAQVSNLTTMIKQQHQTLQQQAAMISGLQQSMHMLMRHITNSGKNPPYLPPGADRKRQGEHLSPKHPTRRPTHGTNNAGEDSEMAIPPDPNAAPGVNESFDSVTMAENTDFSDLLPHVPPKLHAIQSTIAHQHDPRSKSVMKKTC